MSEQVESFRTQYTHELVCPHCGYEHQDSWEKSDNNDRTECVNCEREFFYTRHVFVEYCTSKTDPFADSTQSQKGTE